MDYSITVIDIYSHCLLESFATVWKILQLLTGFSLCSSIFPQCDLNVIFNSFSFSFINVFLQETVLWRSNVTKNSAVDRISAWMADIWESWVFLWLLLCLPSLLVYMNSHILLHVLLFFHFPIMYWPVLTASLKQVIFLITQTCAILKQLCYTIAVWNY